MSKKDLATKTNRLLSDIVAFRTYAKYLPHLSRRETLPETINRNKEMHLSKYPKLAKNIENVYKSVHDLKVMPSMRSMQFGGEAILKNNVRLYNCSGLHMDNPKSFGESLFLLLSGVGAGFSVQDRHVSQLPEIKSPQEEGIFIIHDSIQGWADSVDRLIEAYMYGRIRPQFDFSHIRPKGSYLVTTGAKAPGSVPLKKMLEMLESVLKQAVGRQLKPIEVYDVVCIIADCVLAGGIRRAATICLFDADDQEMLESKTGEWWNKHPYRARSNNSVLLDRDISKEDFTKVFNITKNSGSGEPGFSWTDDKQMLFNPCHEISLETNQFCNLTTMNVTGVKTEAEFLRRVKAATILGTIQASYTDFPFLRPIWKETTEDGALLGISMTGIADNENGTIPKEWLKKGADLSIEVNKKYAKKLGINPAHRLTAIKPEGSASCVLGSSSGIHDRHSEYYIRRVRMSKDDALYKYLQMVMPDLCEDDKFSESGGVVSIPQMSPKDSVKREDSSAIDLLKRAIHFNKHWVSPGHIKGGNKNNVSLTVSVKDEEWDDVCDYMYKNRKLYSGISLLPYDGGTYVQAPFEEIDQLTFEEMYAKIGDIDLTKVLEDQDNTDKSSIVACAGGVCTLDI